MKSIRILPEAEAELRLSTDYYQRESPGLETRFLNKMEAAVLKIQQNPDQYLKIEKNIRKLIIQGFPFNVFYQSNLFL